MHHMDNLNRTTNNIRRHTRIPLDAQEEIRINRKGGKRNRKEKENFFKDFKRQL